MKTARQRYRPSLEALGCICKALLARNLDTCCSMRRQGSLERTKKGSTSNLSRSSRIQSQQGMPCCVQKSSGDCQGSATDTNVAVPKDSCDIQTKRYSSGSCSNSRKSSCLGQSCCLVLEKSRISSKAHARDSSPKSGSSTSPEGQGKQRYKPICPTVEVQRTTVGQTALLQRGSAAALPLSVGHPQISSLGGQRLVSVIQ
jgi:hypothetical protein